VKRSPFLAVLALTLCAPVVALGACGDEGGSSADSSNGGGQSTSAGKKKIRLGLVLPSLSIEAILDVKNGADAEAKKLGNVELLVTGNNDPQQQVAAFENYLAAGVDAIGFDSLDAKSIAPAVKKANEQGVPVIAMLSGSASGEVVTMLEPDQVLSGEKLGKWLAQELGGKGKVAYITGNAATTADQQLREGWGKGLASGSGIDIVPDSPATNFDRAQALNIANNVLTANPDLNGIYGVIDDVALGAFDAAKSAGREGDVVIQGVNGTCEALASILKGELDTTVMNFLPIVGSQFVTIAQDVIDGKSVPATQHVPTYLLDQKRAKAILAGDMDVPAGLNVKERLDAAEAGCK
jgi:ABC-type sugar transport system substrate-binding protein